MKYSDLTDAKTTRRASTAATSRQRERRWERCVLLVGREEDRDDEEHPPDERDEPRLGSCGGGIEATTGREHEAGAAAMETRPMELSLGLWDRDGRTGKGRSARGKGERGRSRGHAREGDCRRSGPAAAAHSIRINADGND